MLTLFTYCFIIDNNQLMMITFKIIFGSLIWLGSSLQWQDYLNHMCSTFLPNIWSQSAALSIQKKNLSIAKWLFVRLQVQFLTLSTFTWFWLEFNSLWVITKTKKLRKTQSKSRKTKIQLELCLSISKSKRNKKQLGRLLINL